MRTARLLTVSRGMQEGLSAWGCVPLVAGDVYPGGCLPLVRGWGKGPASGPWGVYTCKTVTFANFVCER